MDEIKEINEKKKNFLLDESISKNNYSENHKTNIDEISLYEVNHNNNKKINHYLVDEEIEASNNSQITEVSN